MTLKKAFKFMLLYFDGDYEKTLVWFATKVPGLGDVAPLVMISAGRTDKLCKFIDAASKGYNP